MNFPVTYSFCKKCKRWFVDIGDGNFVIEKGSNYYQIYKGKFIKNFLMPNCPKCLENDVNFFEISPKGFAGFCKTCGRKFFRNELESEWNEIGIEEYNEKEKKKWGEGAP